MPIEEAGDPVAPSAWRWPEGAVEGPGDFAQRVRQVLAAAAGQGWQEMVFSDADFADWPLGERAVAQALQDWAASGRSLKLVATHFQHFERAHARFVQWRRQWDHIVQCRACAGAGAPEVPSALWTPAGLVQRIDPLRSRGVSSTEPVNRVALRQALDECFQQGRPAFAASVLGL
ncbi:hypothetical protein PGB34_04990 [Xenophilus arseniciresistens]|uniref:Uncharacterized protein n=1 Tax=Xenophilus arseniciresistens TaxID=1283306 RepID=A0AAE3SY49_9BURK|nr:hypothetical protein [Xenophilus arseniciresistens]MDA7415712.1 hypothetical protein [Xenophilus arseniciresistens]